MVKQLKKRIIILFVLILLLVCLSLLKNNTYICEYIFARGISRFYISAVAVITSLLPFSLYEVLIVLAAVFLIIAIIKIIRYAAHKNGIKAVKILFNVGIIALSVVLIYNVTASFSYNRESLQIDLQEDKPDYEKVISAAQYFMADYNQIAENLNRDADGNIIPPYSFSELTEKIKAEYAKLDNNYFGLPPKAKPMMFSEIMSYLGFSGVFMSITAEPNVNVNIPPKDLPLVAAHEMAHSMGVMRENEANLIAYYVLLNSDDEYLRYSGYAATFSQMFAAVYFTSIEDFEALKEIYSPLILTENQNAALYWQEHKSFINNVSNLINDLYLKVSGIREGTASYENPYDVIDTGETDNQGEVIYEIYYSTVQNLYFTLYDKINI